MSTRIAHDNKSYYHTYCYLHKWFLQYISNMNTSFASADPIFDTII